MKVSFLLEFLSFWNFEYATILGKGKFFSCWGKMGEFLFEFLERDFLELGRERGAFFEEFFE